MFIENAKKLKKIAEKKKIAQNQTSKITTSEQDIVEEEQISQNSSFFFIFFSILSLIQRSYETFSTNIFCWSFFPIQKQLLSDNSTSSKRNRSSEAVPVELSQKRRKLQEKEEFEEEKKKFEERKKLFEEEETIFDEEQKKAEDSKVHFDEEKRIFQEQQNSNFQQHEETLFDNNGPAITDLCKVNSTQGTFNICGFLSDLQQFANTSKRGNFFGYSDGKKTSFLKFSIYIAPGHLKNTPDVLCPILLRSVAWDSYFKNLKTTPMTTFLTKNWWGLVKVWNLIQLKKN